MKILITGATGLIGGEIVRLCQERDIEVNYLTTRKSKVISKEGYHGFLWNPDAHEIDINCFDGVTGIINLAGASISKRWTVAYKKEVYNSRVNSIQTLHKGLAEIDTSSIKAFVSASAIGIYPTSLSDFYTEKEIGVDSSFLGDVVEAWEETLKPLEIFDFSLAKIRIGLVLSERGGALPEMAKPIKNYVGAAFGSGQQWQSWIHITDLADIFLFAINRQLEGTYNGVGPNPVTNTKLVKEIAKVLKKPVFLPNIPEFVMKAILGEMSYILFASQRVSSKKIEKAGYVFRFQNVCRALEAIYYHQEEQRSEDVFVERKEYVS